VKRKESSVTQTRQPLIRACVITPCAAQVCVCVRACVTPRCGAVSATRGPCCRMPASPRILLGASHTWVAHSSWALHIQIAVMNIIREEHRGDVQGTHTHTHTVICECTNTYVHTHTNECVQYIVVHMKHDRSQAHVNRHVR